MTALSIEGLSSGYGRVAVLHDISFRVDEGEVVCVVGANGAGKSTLLKSITGLTKLTAGRVILDGRDITHTGPSSIAKMGIAHVPENRRVFARHTVERNLRLGAFVRRRRKEETAKLLDEVFDRFPALHVQRNALAGALSGGQQQMLAIGMGLMANPRFLLLDEPSLGLAPILVKQTFEAIANLRSAGVTILLVDQLAERALEIADRGVVLALGRVVAVSDAASLRSDATLLSAYLGG